MANDPIPQMLETAIRHHQARELPQAEALYRKILDAQPNHPDALHLLGLIALNVGQANAAIDLIRRAISLRPNVADFHRNLAIALQSDHRLTEAIASWRHFEQLQPNAADAPAQRGALLTIQGHYDQAIASLERAAALDPVNAGIQSNLGSALAIVGRLEDSGRAFHRAVELQPDAAEPHHNLAVSLRQAGRIEEAEAEFRAAIRINPTHLNAGSGLLLTLQYREHPPEEIFAEHREWARRNTEGIPPTAASYPNDRDPARRLRIGYVSSDFREHSVGFFIEPLLIARDPAVVEIFCYSADHFTDATTHRIRKHAAHWRTTRGLSDEDLAQQIRHDQIDILVDLSGHTAGLRLLTFARKPAPVQVTYLGYPDTTGLGAIDYRITDALTDPPNSSGDLGTETLYRLPRCAWCYRPFDAAPTVGPPPFESNDHITFGSFNTLAKLSPKVLDLWTQVLRRLPTSHLVLKSAGLEDPPTRDRFLAIISMQNIDPHRITLLGKSASLQDHLSHYSQIDIALDTYPYHGTTTTCDALWMGVPVITLAGDRHVSRVGVSLVTAVGLPELIGDSSERYIDLAIDLARDEHRLSLLRRLLRDRMRSSALTDAPALARAIESAYRTMWTIWCGANP
jgi:protein O-GlcNAc transferase